MASTSDELFAAIDADDARTVAAILAARPSLAGARDRTGVSALMRARYRSDRAVLDAVRAHLADLDVFEAAALGDADRVSILLAQDPTACTARSADGFTALHLAAFFGRDDVARLLLGRGADVDALGTGWMVGTPLHSAVSGRHAEVVSVLLAAGADPDARQAEGWTPLHGSAHSGEAAITRSLLAAGADPAATNDAGTSVEELAAAAGDAGTIRAIADALAAR